MSRKTDTSIGIWDSILCSDIVRQIPLILHDIINMVKVSDESEGISIREGLSSEGDNT